MKTIHLLLTSIALLLADFAMAQTNITIDVTNYSQNALTAGNTYNITYTNRTFYAGVWEFLCLPFDADKAVLDTAFGEGKYEVQQFANVEGNQFFFTKMETPSMTAGYAYLIRTRTKVTDPVFRNVTVAVTSDPLLTNGATRYHGSTDLGIKGCVCSHSWDVTNEGNMARNYKQENGALVLMDYRSPNLMATSAYVRAEDNGIIPKLMPEDTDFEGVVINDDDPMFVKMANRAQLTNAPTIYIDIPDVSNLDAELTKDRATGLADYHYATIKVVATDDTSSPHYLESFEETNPQDLEIKVRGNSTADPSKRAYRLKFASKKTSSTGKAKKHDLLGKGYAMRNWVLLANTFDHSLIQNAVTSELSQLVGMDFTPGYKFVDLVINGDYRGTYQVSDHCEADPNRINVDEDTGWYIEFQGRADMLDQPMCFSSGVQVNIKNPEPVDEDDEASRNAVINPIKDWVTNLWKPTFETNFTDPTTGWRAYNDEDSWAKFLLLTELTGDYDGLMSVKAYREVDGKLFLGPIWDKDLAYGNISVDRPGVLVCDNGNASSLSGIVQKLYTDPMFIKKMKEMLDQLLAEGLITTLNTAIDNIASTVEQTWQLNFQRWDVSTAVGMEVYHNWTNLSEYTSRLKQWIADRAETIKALLDELYEEAWTVSDFTYDVTSSSSDSMSALGDKMVNVTMTNRSFTKDAWNALTLPFSANADMLAEVFGDEYELREFTEVSSDGAKMIFLPVENRQVEAGKPYLIKPSKTVAAQPLFPLVVLRNPIVNYRLVNGVTVTYGDYSFSGMTLAENKAVDGSVLLIGEDGTSLSVPVKENNSSTAKVNGSMAFITKAEGAADPIISFGEDNPILAGDADGNGVVDNADAVAVMRHLVDNTPENFNPQNADANGDGSIDNADAVIILRMLVE